MSASPHPALRAKIDEVMAGHARRALSQAEIDIPPPPLGGGLVYGADERPVSLPWRRFGAAVLAIAAVLAAAGIGFLAGIAFGIAWQAAVR